MKASLLNKLDILQDRFEELTALLGDAEVISDQNRFRAYSREYAEVEPVIVAYRQLCKVQQDLEGAQALLRTAIPTCARWPRRKWPRPRRSSKPWKPICNACCCPKTRTTGATCSKSVPVPAATRRRFAGDLFRMYSRYAEKQGWRVEILSESEGEHGGYKEVISRVEGDNVYAKLKFESGAHRVQRVPETESQGRIHTSACTVAVLPEPTSRRPWKSIRPTCASTPTAPRRRRPARQQDRFGDSHHPPADRDRRRVSGRAFPAQEPRQGLIRLAAKLQDRSDAAAHKEISETRKLLVGSGDRSERIRTYNFQGRVTDHRVNLTLYSLNEVIGGAVEQVIEPLLQEYRADQLAALGD